MSRARDIANLQSSKITADAGIDIDNITLEDNDISTTNSNGNLTITPNGTGDLQVNSDRIKVRATEGESATLVLAADEDDDGGDTWKIISNTDNTFVIQNDISNAADVTHFSITPANPVANSVAAFAGKATFAGSVSITGNNLIVDNGYGISTVGGLKYIADSDGDAPSGGLIHNFYTDNGSTSALVIAKSGNVAIGDTNVNYRLLVHGTDSSDSGDVTIRIEAGTVSSNSAVNHSTLDLTARSKTSGGTAIAHNVEIRSLGDASGNGGTMAFYTDNTSAAITERMRIDSSGRIGLHTTPNSWNTGTSGRVPIQIGHGSFSGRINDMNTEISNNCYATGTGNDPQWAGMTRYQKQQIEMDNGGSIIFKNAPVVDQSTFDSSPNFSWTERVIIGLDGNTTFNADIIANKHLRLYTTDDQANQWYVYTHTDDTFRINYNGSGADEVVINSNGKFSTTTAIEDNALHTLNSHGSAPYGHFVQFNACSPDNNVNNFFAGGDSSTTRIIIYSDGDIDNHDNSYGATSDERIKQDIVDANSQWDDIKGVKVRNFKKKDDVDQYGDKAWTQIGVIAQELETVSPKLIKERQPTASDIKHSADFGTLYEDGDTIPDGKEVGDIKETKENVKRVNYSVLYMKAIKALQEAMTRIETLEAEVTKLKGE